MDNERRQQLRFELYKLGEPSIIGDFSSMLDFAKDRAFEENGNVIIHRTIDMEHLEGESCPCRPIIVSPTSLQSDQSLLYDLNRFDG